MVQAVRGRNSLVLTLKALLESLGLKRRSRPVDSLEAIAREYAEKHGEALDEVSVEGEQLQ
jgi:hypothetical protein